MEPLSRTEPEEWRIVEALYASLRRFAAVVAPADLEPDDLLQEALVSVLRRHSLSDLDHPAAYMRKTILNAARLHNRGRGRWRKAMTTYAASATGFTSPGYPSDLDELLRLPPRERAALYLHEVEGYRFAWSFTPCQELAGDCLNVLQLDPDHVGVYVLDVAGHGVGAALLSASIQRSFSSVPDHSVLFTRRGGGEDYQIASPALVVNTLNQQFPGDPERARFFTLLSGVLDLRNGRLRYVTAGHPAPLRRTPAAPERAHRPRRLLPGTARQPHRPAHGAGQRAALRTAAGFLRTRARAATQVQLRTLG